LTRHRFRWPVRVYYEDTDAAGIVYYANYLKFMERARTEWLRSMGFDQTDLARDHGLVFVVSRLEVHYRKPARLDDCLQVEAQVLRLGRVGFDMRQSVMRDGEVRLCDATVRIGCLDADLFAPCALPAPLLTELRRED
jgi:acyl-CoA thioester hydrolase